jgi:uncharacterized SAM-binding protein YcdF (DUF218 family)
MTFVLSKIFSVVLQPSTLLLLLCATGLLLTLWRNRSPWGLRFLIAGIGGLAACAVLPVGTWLMRPLEDRFPPLRPMPAQVDGIVVIGGAIELDESANRGVPAFNVRAGRMIKFVALARRYPHAQLLFSGGSSDLFADNVTEADVARTFFTEMGVPPDRVIFESKSRNTRENALYSRHLAHLKPGQRWLLVTSAADMPRAVGSFRAVGWPVIAYPSDFRTYHDRAGFLPGLPGGLSDTDWAAHEWIGLLCYRLRGWTLSFFPGPIAEEEILGNLPARFAVTGASAFDRPQAHTGYSHFQQHRMTKR